VALEGQLPPLPAEAQAAIGMQTQHLPKLTVVQPARPRAPQPGLGGSAHLARLLGMGRSPFQAGKHPGQQALWPRQGVALAAAEGLCHRQGSRRHPVATIKTNPNLGRADPLAPQAHPGQQPRNFAIPHEQIVGPLELHRKPQGLELLGQPHRYRKAQGGRSRQSPSPRNGRT